MSRILIVEDEQHLADGLRFNLEAECYDTEVVDTGEAALDRVCRRPTRVDLVVLDVMLPGSTASRWRRTLARAGPYVPILMLTARGRADDVVKGFEAGADDYLPKPFELTVLIARIGALLRRHAWGTSAAPPARRRRRPTATTSPGARSILQRSNCGGDGRTLPLTLMEANLLRYLVQREGQVVSRKDILEQVWGVHEDTDTRAIDNFIVRLRRHIEDDAAEPRHLLTVRSVGYRFMRRIPISSGTEAPPAQPTYAPPRPLFQPDPRRARRRARAVRQVAAACRWSARTGTSIRGCWRTTRRFPIRPRCIVIPDHYIFRMLYSQGVPMEALGIPRATAAPVETDPRDDLAAVRRALPSVSRHARPARGSTHELDDVFGVTRAADARIGDADLRQIERTAARSRSSGRARCSSASASRCCARPTRRPTRSSSTSTIAASGWTGACGPTFRPDLRDQHPAPAVADGDRAPRRRRPATPITSYARYIRGARGAPRVLQGDWARRRPTTRRRRRTPPSCRAAEADGAVRARAGRPRRPPTTRARSRRTC